MPSTFGMFDRELKLATADLAPEAIRRALAAFARESVAEVVSSGKGSTQYERIVNGRPGLSEDAVELPGPIVYVFSNWKLAIDVAIEELQRRVPRKSGTYAASFIVVVGGAIVRDYAKIAPDAEVIIINYRPYTRKMEVGENGPAGDRHFELSRSAFNRRFASAFSAKFLFLTIADGVHPQIPYVLKRGSGRSRRKDRQAGQPITYPALVLNAI